MPGGLAAPPRAPSPAVVLCPRDKSVVGMTPCTTLLVLVSRVVDVLRLAMPILSRSDFRFEGLHKLRNRSPASLEFF